MLHNILVIMNNTARNMDALLMWEYVNIKTWFLMIQIDSVKIIKLKILEIMVKI